MKSISNKKIEVQVESFNLNDTKLVLKGQYKKLGGNNVSKYVDFEKEIDVTKKD